MKNIGERGKERGDIETVENKIIIHIQFERHELRQNVKAILQKIQHRSVMANKNQMIRKAVRKLKVERIKIRLLKSEIRIGLEE